MGLKVKKQVLISLSLAMVLFSLLSIKAQTEQLIESDKAQIVATILKKQKFKELKHTSNNSEEIVYLLANGISFQRLPQINGIRFVSITEKQIDELKKTGVEYYSFSEFEVLGKTVEVTFARDYIHFGKHSNGNATAYECRKVSGRWKIKGGKPSVWVGENN